MAMSYGADSGRRNLQQQPKGHPEIRSKANKGFKKRIKGNEVKAYLEAK